MCLGGFVGASPSLKCMVNATLLLKKEASQHSAESLVAVKKKLRSPVLQFDLR